MFENVGYCRSRRFDVFNDFHHYRHIEAAPKLSRLAVAMVYGPTVASRIGYSVLIDVQRENVRSDTLQSRVQPLISLIRKVALNAAGDADVQNRATGGTLRQVRNKIIDWLWLTVKSDHIIHPHAAAPVRQSVAERSCSHKRRLMHAPR